VSVAPAFEKARADGRGVLVGYLPAGFPTVDGAIAAIKAMVSAGVDLVEVGMPYSDPVMDGPVIQAASDAALRGGVRLRDLFRTVEAVAATGVPTVVMTYWNPVEQYLIPEEAQPWLVASDEHSLDRIFLVAPSSGDARIASTVAACRGFVYATAVMGVTGAREKTSDAAPSLVARTRAAAGTLPVGVGLGVSNGAQAAAVAGYADAVIVGSALVRCLLEAPDEAAGLAALRSLSADLADGVRRPGR
jgi:tryptophan synthase alpha chain